MKVSKISALNYITQSDYFFPTRADRNNAFLGDDIPSGTTIAVAGEANVDMTDETSALWSIEKFNGANWVLESLDSNYSLVITDEGLAALSAVQEGKYIFDISCVKVKQNNIVNPSTPLTSWTDANFTSAGDIVLNTSWGDESFSITNNKTLKWRNSLGNAGMQLTLMIDSDTYGYQTSGNAQTRLEDYTIGAIGLYVKDQRDVTNANIDGILFAIGNLQEPISKYTTNATRVGNSIKLYFNLALSNLGQLANITSTPEDFHSLPEVNTEKQLETTTTSFPSTAYPYNVYLVDNYMNTNASALALRTVAGVSIDEAGVDHYTWKWTYLTPQDDTITVSSDDFARDAQGRSLCKNYMAVSWDPNYEDPITHEISGKFVPANGDRYLSDTTEDSNPNNSVLTGIKIENTIIFAGNIRNFSYAYKYSAALSPTYKGKDYRTGDILYRIINNRQFFVSVSNVNDSDMRVESISEISPNGGDTAIEDTRYEYWYCARRGDNDPSYDQSKVARIKVTSTNVSNINYSWSFPSSWLNKPLYADIDENAGKFTTRETECFIGWCTGTGEGNSSIKLALDLRNEASYTDYGTTRYSTQLETSDVAHNSGTSELTSVNPAMLQANYLQKTKVSGNPGESFQNPVVVQTHVKFNETIIGKGVTGIPTTSERSDVSFYGLAFRAMWGDLAEFYESDRIYPAGTLICMGSGEKEITIASKECNGVISDKPGYELGEKLTANHLPVALIGKVPVIFDNRCVPHFGDRIYLSRYEDGKASTENNGFCLGKVIDKRPNLEEHRNNVLCSIRISF